MKKTLLFVSALCLGTSAAFAQLDTIPNANFEYWTTDNTTNPSKPSAEPIGWGTFNNFSYSGNVPNPFNPTTTIAATFVFPDTAATNATGADILGTGTIRLRTGATVTAMGSTLPRAIPSLAISGVNKSDITFVNAKPVFKGGFPFRQRANALVGKCKYVSAGVNDSATIGVALTKWNKTLNKRDTIGVGQLSLTDTMQWQNFAVPITYIAAAVAPDTAVIILASNSNVTFNNMSIGSTLWADSIEFDYGCNLDPAIVSLNGASDQLPKSGDTLYIDANVPYSSTITFFIPDTLTGMARLDSIQIDTSVITMTGLANGTYTLTSNWANGRIGGNTIACVTISGLLTSPQNGKGTITVDPILYVGGTGVGVKTSALDPTRVKPTVVIIGDGSSVGIEDFSLSGGLTVNQNKPNPFDNSTTINFNTSIGGTIDFIVTDVLGRQVYDTNINATAGDNTFIFTTDLANGTYFFSLSDGTNTVTKKMVITE